MKNFQQQTNTKADLKLWGGFFLLFLLYVPALYFYDLPLRDVAYRYAPAAEAFARGDWQYAFHPRMQVLHPTVAGIFTYLFSIDGFLAAKLSSLLFYALGIFPLFYLLKEVFDKRIAYWGILAYIFASRITINGYSGLRESHKQFVILLLALGLVFVYKYRDQLKGYLLSGLACGLAFCTRNDLILFALTCFFIVSYWDVEKRVFPWRSMLGGLVGLVVSIPEIWANYAVSGYAIHGTRFATIYHIIFHRVPTCGSIAILTLGLFFAIFLIALPISGWMIRRKTGKIIFFCMLGIVLVLFWIQIERLSIPLKANKEMAGDFIQDFLRGQFPHFFALMLPGLLYRIIRKKMTGPEWILFSLYLLHGVLIILLILGSDRLLYVSERYLLPAVPLYFGWIGVTALLIWRYLAKIPKISAYRLKIAWCLVVGLAIGMYVDSLSPVFSLYGKGKQVKTKKQVQQIAKIIQDDYSGKKYWEPAFSLSTYYPNKCPVVWFEQNRKIGVAAYQAGGGACEEIKDAQYIVLDAKYDLSALCEKMGEPIPDKYGPIQVWRRK